MSTGNNQITNITQQPTSILMSAQTMMPVTTTIKNSQQQIYQPTYQQYLTSQQATMLHGQHHQQMLSSPQQQLNLQQQQQLPVGLQQQQQQLMSLPPALLNNSSASANQQQQVPMTTIMIPATAAAQLQSASYQIQQATQQAMANNNVQSPQILVFMIPYMLPANNQQLPPTIPPTPVEQSSLNGTLVRHSNNTSSINRPQQQLIQQQQYINLQQATVGLTNHHQNGSSSLSSLSGVNNSTISATTAPAPPTITTTATTTTTTNGGASNATIGNMAHNRAVSSLSHSNHSTTKQQQQQPEKFYIKANFSYQATRNKMELSFQKGDILHVIDTLQNSEYAPSQYWLATKVKPNGKDAEKGLIPDQNKAEEIAMNQRSMTDDLNEPISAGGTLNANGSSANNSNSNSNGTSNNGQDPATTTTGSVLSASVGRVNFLKRRVAQRSKSLCKDNWDNVVFDIGSFKLPTYERVVYKHPGFCRPVVIFGPLADVAREKLLKDYPEKYSYPTGFNQSKDHPKVIRLKGIVEVMEQGKHALLDITPSAVEKLNHANYVPIVIFMKTDSKSIIKEFRSRAAKSLDPNAKDEDTLKRHGKSSRKLLDHSIKLEKAWFHVFTATLDLSTMGSEMWYRKLRETIENQQSVNVWMGERRSDQKKLINSLTSTTSASAVLQQHQQQQHQQQQQQHHHQQQQQQQLLNDRFNDCLNITSKSTIDLIPPEGIYGNRSQLRNAYAHSLAQKLARASSEPKLNGNNLLAQNGCVLPGDNSNNNQQQQQQVPLPSNHHQYFGNNNGNSNQLHNNINNNNHHQHHHHLMDNFDDDDDDLDDDDDDNNDIIKKPFPEFENSSSISSNGAASYGQGSVTGAWPSSNQLHQQQMTYQHYPPPPIPLIPTKSDLSNSNNNNNSSSGSRPSIISNQQLDTNQIYSQRQAQQQLNHIQQHDNISPLYGTNCLSAASIISSSINRDYHMLAPLTGPAGATTAQQASKSTNHNQDNNNNNSNNQSIIDLSSRNHETRGSAYQVYSDYNYYNLNKI